MGGGGGKGGKGGGSSGSIDVTSNSNSVIDSDSVATINSTSRTDLASTSNNRIDTAAQLQVVGLDNVRLKADTSAENRTQLEMDLKPLQVDLCLKLGMERFPSTRICRPASRHFGLTLFGVEILGFNYSSETRTVIEDMRHRPFVAADLVAGGHGHEHSADGVSFRLGD